MNRFLFINVHFGVFFIFNFYILLVPTKNKDCLWMKVYPGMQRFGFERTSFVLDVFISFLWCTFSKGVGVFVFSAAELNVELRVRLTFPFSSERPEPSGAPAVGETSELCPSNAAWSKWARRNHRSDLKQQKQRGRKYCKGGDLWISDTQSNWSLMKFCSFSLAPVVLLFSSDRGWRLLLREFLTKMSGFWNAPILSKAKISSPYSLKSTVLTLVLTSQTNLLWIAMLREWERSEGGRGVSEEERRRRASLKEKCFI